MPQAPNYPTVKVNGRTKAVHRIRAEHAYGGHLPIGAEVHHVDGTTSSQSPLVICQDAAFHDLLHIRTRVVRAGGNPNTDAVCSARGTVKPLTEFAPAQSRVNGHSHRCRDCSAERERQRRATSGPTINARLRATYASRKAALTARRRER